MFDRRQILTLGVAATAAPNMAFATAMSSRVTAYGFSFTGLDGKPILLAEHAGHPIMVVNTASLCGYTPQYTGLQELWTRYGARGLFMVGVPSNDFGGQEPGGVSEIEKTALGDYHVTFPLTQKATVKGPAAHPFYRWAAQERPLEAPRWNFHKYLISRAGALKVGFASALEPTDPRIIAAIETELPAD
jgi:glutathione peroxidase